MSDDNLNSDVSLGRSESRQALVQFLVQLDFRFDSYEENLNKFIDYCETNVENDAYFIEVSKGIHDSKAELDKKISSLMEC